MAVLGLSWGLTVGLGKVMGCHQPQQDGKRSTITAKNQTPRHTQHHEGHLPQLLPASAWHCIKGRETVADLLSFSEISFMSVLVIKQHKANARLVNR